MNSNLIAHFVSLSEAYKHAGDYRRSTTFSKVADTLSHVEEKIDEEYDVTQWAGIGQSSANEVLEFLETGTSTRLEELLELNSSDDQWESTDKSIHEMLVDKMVANSGSSPGPLMTTLIMWMTMNSYKTIEDVRSNIDTAPVPLIEAGLRDVI